MLGSAPLGLGPRPARRRPATMFEMIRGVLMMIDLLAFKPRTPSIGRITLSAHHILTRSESRACSRLAWLASLGPCPFDPTDAAVRTRPRRFGESVVPASVDRIDRSMMLVLPADPSPLSHPTTAAPLNFITLIDAIHPTTGAGPIACGWSAGFRSTAEREAAGAGAGAGAAAAT